MGINPVTAGGGVIAYLGVWNAYNQVPIQTLIQDSSANFQNSGSGWEVYDAANSGKNQLYYVDGLGTSYVDSTMFTDAAWSYANGTAGELRVGVNRDSTSATPTRTASFIVNGAASGLTGTLEVGLALVCEAPFIPSQGVHYLQAMEWVGNVSGSPTIDIGTGLAGSNVMTAKLLM